MQTKRKIEIQGQICRSDKNIGYQLDTRQDNVQLDITLDINMKHWQTMELAEYRSCVGNSNIVQIINDLNCDIELSDCMIHELDRNGNTIEGAIGFFNRNCQFVHWMDIDKQLPTAKELAFQVFELVGDQSSPATLTEKARLQLRYITKKTLNIICIDENLMFLDSGTNKMKIFKKALGLYNLLDGGTSNWYRLRAEWRKERGINRDNRTYQGQPNRDMLKAA